ncbi:hypothetical protein, partial [Veillonella sp.]|uniref:hypothetical protein n=1 Tax=Veillonella sp. TaxID=1926307 RepID=UPI003995B567
MIKFRSVKNDNKADLTNDVLAACVSLELDDAVGTRGVPVNVGELNGALRANKLVIVVAKLGSSPNAAASLSRVSSVPGAELISLATAD